MAKWMQEKGVVHAFGIIGGGNVVLFDAIAKLVAFLCSDYSSYMPGSITSIDGGHR